MINNQADKRSAYWQQQVEAWQNSKLSQTKFCQNQSLSYDQFSYWRRKLESATHPVQKAVSKRGFTQVNLGKAPFADGFLVTLRQASVLSRN